MGNGTPVWTSGSIAVRHPGEQLSHSRRFFLTILAVVFSFLAGSAFAAGQYAIIPLPQKMEPRDGAFVLQSSTQIVVAVHERAPANYLAEQLRKPTGYSLKVRAT